MHQAAQIEIRRATAEDAQAIAGVLYLAFVEFRPLYTEGGFAATVLDAEQVLSRMKEGPIWLLLRGETPVGTVAAVIKEESVYVRGMAVISSARGSGAGSKLLREVENWSAEQGYARLFLSTTPFLHAAIRLYEKSGFRRTGDGLHDLAGTPLFTMEKIVSK